MSTNIKLEDEVRDEVRELIIKVCAVLYNHGYKKVPIGAMMRILGTSNEQASTHDNEYFELDKDFLEMLGEHVERNTVPLQPPPGTTLH
jgi:hypothetical protein